MNLLKSIFRFRADDQTRVCGSSPERFARSDDGSTAVEYAVMIAMIILVCIGAIRGMGGENGSLWTESLDQIETEFAAAGT